MKTSKSWLAAAIGVALVSAAGAAPYPHGPVVATDIGPASAFAENSTVSVTVALKPNNSDARDKLIESVYTPGAPEFRQFLTPQQFQERFGPTQATIAAVTKSFEAQGLAVAQSATGQLHVSGSAEQIERAFAVQLHSYAVAATDSAPAYRFRAPLGAAHVPAGIASSVQAVLGLDTRPRMTPHLRHSAQLPKVQAGSAPNTPDAPGLWTVVDFAQYYDVTPLYQDGISGQGRTLAIMTFASFTPSDAYAYWSALGLHFNPNRITQVLIDGGSGPPSDAAGSQETTLDVEQSGGISPSARILVYEAPNTAQGEVDLFATAIDSNRADTVSISWGEWELFDTASAPPELNNGPVTNPNNGEQTSILLAVDDILAQAALQGQSVFASSADYGAYDSANSLPFPGEGAPPPTFNPVLSVDDPASQRYITAAGATTLPGTQIFLNSSGAQIGSVNIAQEQAWGWDYLIPFCTSIGDDPVSCGIYPIGSGGGVSLYFDRPFYQWGVPGMADSVRGQTLYQLTPAPVTELVSLPAGVPGRNVPDLSFNGDPDTGYQIYYTSSVSGFEILTYWGGTSFVDPQLNGVTSLYVEALHHRIGLLNPALYYIASSSQAYHGRNAPLRAITHGDNWFWHAHAGYNQATGLGVPDVANLLRALQQLEP
jgi:kumamolisin